MSHHVQTQPDLIGLLKGLDGFLSAKLATARHKHDLNTARHAAQGSEPKGCDMGLIAADRLEYFRDEVRAALAFVSGNRGDK